MFYSTLPVFNYFHFIFIQMRRLKTGCQPTVKKLLSCDKYSPSFPNKDNTASSQKIKKEFSDVKLSVESFSSPVQSTAHQLKRLTCSVTLHELKSHPALTKKEKISVVPERKPNVCMSIPKEITAAAVLASQSPSPIQLGPDKQENPKFGEKSIMVLPPTPPSNPAYERISPIEVEDTKGNLNADGKKSSPCSDGSETNESENQIKSRPGPSILGPLLHKQKRIPVSHSLTQPSRPLTIATDVMENKCFENVTMVPQSPLEANQSNNISVSPTLSSSLISSKTSAIFHPTSAVAGIAPPTNCLPENGRWHVPKSAHSQTSRTSNRSEETKPRSSGIRQSVIQHTTQNPPEGLLAPASSIPKFARLSKDDSLPQPAHMNHMKRSNPYSADSYHFMSPVTAHTSKTTSNTLAFSAAHPIEPIPPYYSNAKRQKLSNNHATPYLDSVHRPSTNDLQSEPTDLSMKTLKKSVNGRVNYKNSVNEHRKSETGDPLTCSSFHPHSSSPLAVDACSPLDMTTSSKKYNSKVCIRINS